MREGPTFLSRFPGVFSRVRACSGPVPCLFKSISGKSVARGVCQKPSDPNNFLEILIRADDPVKAMGVGRQGIVCGGRWAGGGQRIAELEPDSGREIVFIEDAVSSAGDSAPGDAHSAAVEGKS